MVTVKPYLHIFLILTPLYLLACGNEPWRNPRERFENFSKHLSKREITEAMDFIDPEDRKSFEASFAEIPDEYKDGISLISVGSMRSPRSIRRIELELPETKPASGTKLELTLHYLNDDKESAYLVWRDQWYVDLIR